MVWERKIVKKTPLSVEKALDILRTLNEGNYNNIYSSIFAIVTLIMIGFAVIFDPIFMIGFVIAFACSMGYFFNSVRIQKRLYAYWEKYDFESFKEFMKRKV